MTRAGTGSRDVRYNVLVGAGTAALAGVLVGVALSATSPVTGVTNVSEAVSVALPVARVVLDLAAAVTVGLSLLPVLLGAAGRERQKLSEPVLARARRGALAGSVVWLVAALALLVLQTAEYRPEADTVSVADIGAYVGAVGTGKALLVVAGLALGLVVLGVLAVRGGERVPPEIRTGLGLFALLPLPVTGHASEHELSSYTMISVELHVLAVVAWCGGLGAMIVLLAANRTLLAQALPRFSKLATVCLALVAVTGLFNGLVQLASNPTVDLVPALFTTAYGRLVLGKVCCLGVIAALGGYVRWRLLPSIVRHQRTALVTWATLELATMGLAFGLAAVLARAPTA